VLGAIVLCEGPTMNSLGREWTVGEAGHEPFTANQRRTEASGDPPTARQSAVGSKTGPRPQGVLAPMKIINGESPFFIREGRTLERSLTEIAEEILKN